MTTQSYRLPPLFYRLINPFVRFLVLQFGLGSRGDQDVMRILRVQGRKSGRFYDIPVRVARRDHQRYLLSMLGETQWVRNLRVAGVAQLIVGAKVEQVRAEEVRGEDKAAFIAWYCQHPQYTMRARYGLGANIRNLTQAEIERLASLYPVFRLASIHPSPQGELATGG